VSELKAFLGVRIAMEAAVIKRRFEFYFSDRRGFLFKTPGFRKVFSRDRFMAIWKFLHAVDEDDPALKKLINSTKFVQFLTLLCQDFVISMFRHRICLSMKG